MGIQTIAWAKDRIRIIDQTRLPSEFRYLYIRDIHSLVRAIRTMQIRGAPALAAAAALGVVLAAKISKAKNSHQLKRELERQIAYLSRSRPTAVNLFWGLERMLDILNKNKDASCAQIRAALFQQARQIIQQDRIACRRMAEIGARLIKDRDNILTICNAGILATIDYGTALGVIYKAKQLGKQFTVFACETRPLLQGARLTCWELKKKGIEVVLICDSLAATLMHKGRISKVFVGADRIAGNGDVANKVGTYNLAVSAKYHKVPFYVVAPLSSFDLKIKSGCDIPIEERSSFEVTHNFFKRPIAPLHTKVLNPAFDVTPHNLITAIITDKGIIKPPFRDILQPNRGTPFDPIGRVSP